MKRIVLVSSLLLLSTLLLPAQVDITLTGSAADGSVVSGEILSWTITVPAAGDFVQNELWIDVNMNGVKDPGIDKLLFVFTQQDGGQVSDGPGDDDGMANGVISTAFPAGIAPVHWVFVVNHPSGGDVVAFEVTPMASPVATITGTITVPGGYDKAFFIIEASPDMESSSMAPFWHGVTDANGNYTIAMGGDPVSVNPWRVQLAEGAMGYGRLIPVRNDTLVNVGATPRVVDFTFIEGTILTGRVVDQNNQPIANEWPHTHDASNIENDAMNFGGNTDADGVFAFAVPPGSYKLHYTGRGYFDSWWNGQTDFNSATTIVVTTEDTIANLNGSMVRGGLIQGQVRNYGMPVQANITIFTLPSNVVWNGQTQYDGRYDATVTPGTYYVQFDYMSETQYYDHTGSSPGDGITVTGTETFSSIDADFTVGLPPELPTPQILNVWDYPFDNGRQVYVKWAGIESELFSLGLANSGFGVQSYSIWRIDGPDTVYLRSVPAVMQTNYTAAAGTLKDSTKTEGQFLSTFIVRAHMTFNLIVTTSQPMSGYSLDNMAPGVPAGLGSSVSGVDVVLRWVPNEDEDFKYYTVYRSTTPDFSLQGLTPYGFTAATEYVDVGAATGTFYYRLTATDHAGNESKPSVIVNSSGTTVVGENGEAPASFRLLGNYPNPFNPTTKLSYELPFQAHVSIVVYNSLGEVVARLVDAARPAGTFTVDFDASGLTTGLYFARLQAGAFTAVQKMSLIK